MDNYRIIFTRSARKELEAMQANLVERIFPKIEALSAQPRPRGSKKIQGEKDLGRIRIGEYRVIWSIASFIELRMKICL